MYFSLPIRIERELTPEPNPLMGRYRFGAAICARPVSHLFYNFRLGKSQWIEETELTADTVADFLPQDAAMLSAYFALVDEGAKPAAALLQVLQTHLDGPK